MKSINHNRYYTGCTKSLSKRLKLHNDKKVRSTKAFAPWEVVYKERFEIKSEAFKREKEIKSYKGGNAFISLLQ